MEKTQELCQKTQGLTKNSMLWRLRASVSLQNFGKKKPVLLSLVNTGGTSITKGQICFICFKNELRILAMP